MFGHTHVIEGATITHSHFHGNHHTQNPDGGHTSDELTLIQHLTLTNILSGEEICFESVDQSPYTEYYTLVDYKWVEGDRYTFSAPRAPPTL
ncbi:MAG: hypothetical protein SNH01_05885 [Rikenellaceae bacterium]